MTPLTGECHICAVRTTGTEPEGGKHHEPSCHRRKRLRRAGAPLHPQRHRSRQVQRCGQQPASRARTAASRTGSTASSRSSPGGRWQRTQWPAHKGTRVVVAGKLTRRSWEAEDGSKRFAVEIIADEVATSLKFATAQVSKLKAARPGRRLRAGGRRVGSCLSDSLHAEGRAPNGARPGCSPGRTRAHLRGSGLRWALGRPYPLGGKGSLPGAMVSFARILPS